MGQKSPGMADEQANLNAADSPCSNPTVKQSRQYRAARARQFRALKLPRDQQSEFAQNEPDVCLGACVRVAMRVEIQSSDS